MAQTSLPMGPTWEESLSTGLGRGVAHGLQAGIAPQLSQLGINIPTSPGGLGTLGGLGMPEPTSFKDMLSLQKSQLEREKLASNVASKEKDLRFKETKETRKEYIDRAKSAQQNLDNLSRMEQLINSGKLHGPVMNKIMNKIGLEGWRNPQSVEFEKLSTDFLRNAKAIFGSRVTQGEVMRYLQTVPTLMISDEGKRAVMENMRKFNEAALLKRKAMDNIISSHGGVPPVDLEAQIEEVTGPILESIKSEVFDQGPRQRKAQTFDTLPDPSQLSGRRIRDDKGNILMSDGKQWRKA